jgi:DNA-binding transcriptional regulator YiaG
MPRRRPSSRKQTAVSPGLARGNVASRTKAPSAPEALPPAEHIDRPSRASSLAKSSGVASTDVSRDSSLPRASPGLNARQSTVVEPQDYSPEDIRAIREQLGTSQAVFASLLGVSKSLVEHWERGIRGPSVTVRRLLDAIRIAPDQFLDRLTHDRRKNPLRAAQRAHKRAAPGEG